MPTTKKERKLAKSNRADYGTGMCSIGDTREPAPFSTDDYTPVNFTIDNEFIGRAYNVPLVLDAIKVFQEDKIKEWVSLFNEKSAFGKLSDFLEVEKKIISQKDEILNYKSNLNQIKTSFVNNTANINYKESKSLFKKELLNYHEKLTQLLSKMEAAGNNIKPAQFDEILKSINGLKLPKRKGKMQGYLYDTYEKLVGLTEDIKLNKIFSELETNNISMRINDLKAFFGKKTVNQFLNTGDLTIGTLRLKIIEFKKNIALGSAKAIELLEYLEKTIITVFKQTFEGVPSIIKTNIESLTGKLTQELFPKMSKTSKVLSEFAGALLDLPDLLLDGFSVAFALQDYELRELYNVQQQKEIEKNFWTSAFTFLGGLILFIGGIIAAYLACIPALICLAVVGIFLGIYELITSNDAIGQFGYWLSSEIGLL